MRVRFIFSACVVLTLVVLGAIANASQQAYNPYPADGAEDVPHNVCLTWSPADQEPCPPPLTHYVYFSTDYNQVAIGDLSTLVDVTQDNDVCVEGLCLGETYYWRVDSAWDCNTVPGNIWNFTVTKCVIFDDMDSYDNSCDPTAIWETWIDGTGHCFVPGNSTGSTVYSATDPDPEQSDKVMEYYYNNAQCERCPPYSEVGRPLEPPLDLTDECERVLVLWFYGDPDNDTESMWVFLSDDTNDGQVTYGTLGPDSPDDIRNAEWKDFVIDLNDFADAGVDMSAVTLIAIGFGERGGYGTFPDGPIGVVYFDDVSLCTTICVPRYAPDGDIDDDCDVDGNDVELLFQDWLEEPCP